MPFNNPSAIQSVYNADTSIIKQGTAFVASGGLTQGALNIKHPTDPDSFFIGVATTDIAVGDIGNGSQVLLGNIQVRLASAVSKDDRLNVANTAGEFQKAGVNAINALYVAMNNGATGTTTTWAAPCLPVSTPKTMTNPVVGTTADPTQAGTTFAIIPEMDKTVTSTTGNLKIEFHTTLKLLPADLGNISIFVDGTEVLDSRRTFGATLPALMQLDGLGANTFTLVTGLTLGSHRVTVQSKAITGSVRFVGTQRSLVITEE